MVPHSGSVICVNVRSSPPLTRVSNHTTCLCTFIIFRYNSHLRINTISSYLEGKLFEMQKYRHDTILGFLAADVRSTAAVTLGPRPPTLVGGVAVLTGAAAGTTLTSHLLLRFFGSSPIKRRIKKETCSLKMTRGCANYFFFLGLFCFRAVFETKMELVSYLLAFSFTAKRVALIRS